jgi:hypothetical protein
VIPPARFDTSFDAAAVTLNAAVLTPDSDPIPLYALDAQRPADELIDESYAKSPLLQEMLAWLTDGQQHRKWPPSLAKAVKVPIAETRAVRGRIYVRDRLFIDPGDIELQTQLIYRAHDTRGAGHPGRTKTLDLMNRTY